MEIRAGAKGFKELDPDPRTNDNNGVKPIEEILLFNSTLKHVTKFGHQLSMEDKNNLQQVIWVHADLFAWSMIDMPGIDLAFHCHKLSICWDAKPIAHRKRKMREERCQVVQ